MKKPEFNVREPIYQQIVRYFKKMIISGRLQPGQELPSRRELGRFLEVDPNTVQRAFSEMESRGWIYTEPGLPSRMTEDEQLLAELKSQWLDEQISSFFEAVRLVDIPLADFEGRLQKELRRLKLKEDRHD